jgi:hypothetical protein
MYLVFAFENKITNNIWFKGVYFNENIILDLIFDSLLYAFCKT